MMSISPGWPVGRIWWPCNAFGQLPDFERRKTLIRFSDTFFSKTSSPF